jgi:hypothetical protein
MKLLSLNKYLYLFIYLFILILPSQSDETIDIWSKENKKNDTIKAIDKIKKPVKKIVLENSNLDQQISIIEEKGSLNEERKLFGIYDPEKNNFNLNLWSQTDGNEIKKIFKRIEKINLSNFAEDLFINTILTYSYQPSKNLTNEEFTNLKINWLIKNKKDEILEIFLNKNQNYENKHKIIEYLVDKNIAKANLNQGCEKVEFISKEIKNKYLEKFKIYCLIFKDKKNEAQLLLDILREENLSDKFFDNKINFLLGVSKKTDDIILDNNLLNFYLSSITVTNFKYEPNENTDKYIWEYLNAANLIELQSIEDLEKIKTLEFAANKNTYDKEKIFEIYKQIPFDLSSLISAENTYQSLSGVQSRALIYQRYLLSDNIENKIQLLAILKQLFKKDKLSNVYTKFMSDKLREIEENKIPEEYKKFAKNNIISETEYKLGKIKYDDKILHKSRVIRFYTEEDTPKQKTQKDFQNVYKKIKRNKNYFFSAKDLALVESLEIDGLIIPKEINPKEISKKYTIPENLNELIKTENLGLLTLKFVEILGEDEVQDLDPETIYFIVHLMNQAKFKKLRNKVLSTALPLRT